MNLLKSLQDYVPFLIALLTAIRQRHTLGLRWVNPYTVGCVAGMIWFPLVKLGSGRVAGTEAILWASLSGGLAGAFAGFMACVYVAVFLSVFSDRRNAH